MCLLFRNTTSFGESLVEPYALALEARAIPHVVVGGRSSRDREEILAMANAVNAIERPDDALSVYATLRGPLFGLTDDALLVHRETVGPLHPLAPLGEALFDEARRPVAEALDLLRELHLRRNRRPIADTLGRLLDATRAHAGIANWLNGEQALANALRVLDVAHRFEASGGASFRSFATELEERVASGAGVDAPVVEEREEGVRVMTVHAAKGLELPVVVLCDPALSRRRKSLSRASYVDSPRRLRVGTLAGCVPVELRERAPDVLAAAEAEEVRLAYVAATRARELLVVPCVGDAPFEGGGDPLHEAPYPAPKAWRDAGPAPCRRVGYARPPCQADGRPPRRRGVRRSEATAWSRGRSTRRTTARRASRPACTACAARTWCGGTPRRSGSAASRPAGCGASRCWPRARTATPASRRTTRGSRS